MEKGKQSGYILSSIKYEAIEKLQKMREKINEKIDDQINDLEKSLQPIIYSFVSTTYER